MVFQYPHQGDEAGDQQKAVTLLQLLAGALTEFGVRYVGFEPRRDWQSCTRRAPAYAFWRDHADRWRFLDGHPARYFREALETLPDSDRGTPVEAYLLWSLGLVEQRRERFERSIGLFERAYAILEAAGDPNGLRVFLLVPLIHHHLSSDTPEGRLQGYIDAYARLADTTTSEGDYLPMVKVAPVYPLEAQRRRQEGYVLLEFTVNELGRVENPRIVEEHPEGVFGEAALMAAREFQYLPKVVDGVAVSTAGVRNLVTFELR